MRLIQGHTTQSAPTDLRVGDAREPPISIAKALLVCPLCLSFRDRDSPSPRTAIEIFSVGKRDSELDTGMSLVKVWGGPEVSSRSELMASLYRRCAMLPMAVAEAGTRTAQSVFAPTQISGLSRVSATSGVRVSVTKTDGRTRLDSGCAEVAVNSEIGSPMRPSFASWRCCGAICGRGLARGKGFRALSARMSLLQARQRGLYKIPRLVNSSFARVRLASVVS